MVVGYVRVSSFEQNEECKIEEFKNFGVERFLSGKYQRVRKFVHNLKK